MTAFRKSLERQITQNGPLAIDSFMARAIAHYYTTRDPFGAGGDFTTAPEISQMFGEMIGVFFADIWLKTGRPDSFILAEAGPGRGTLMADMLRATKNIPGFHAALSVHLLEISPVLREQQKQTLSAFPVTWHDTLETLPPGPLFFVANEFLDALPTRQFQFQSGQWHERVIGLHDNKLSFGLGPPIPFPRPGMEGAIFESSPVRENFVHTLAARLTAHGGTALLMDYGHDHSANGDTLQAVKAHAYADILATAGDADLTTHVDFEPLTAAAAPCAVHGPVGQGAFLRALGIEHRAKRLGLPEDYTRLCDDSQMGTLFRVMALCSDPAIIPEGFAP